MPMSMNGRYAYWSPAPRFWLMLPPRMPMKITGMMIVTTIETGLRTALRTHRDAIANVAFAARRRPRRLLLAGDGGAPAMASLLTPRPGRLGAAGRRPPRGWPRGPGGRS